MFKIYCFQMHTIDGRTVLLKLPLILLFDLTTKKNAATITTDFKIHTFKRDFNWSCNEPKLWYVVLWQWFKVRNIMTWFWNFSIATVYKIYYHTFRKHNAFIFKYRWKLDKNVEILEEPSLQFICYRQIYKIPKINITFNFPYKIVIKLI